MKTILASFIGLFLTSAVIAGEHGACRDLDFPYQDRTPDELRTIAASCNSEPMANLYYSRAQHVDLMAEHAIMSQLEQVSNDRDDWTLNQDQLFLALVDVFSAQHDMSDTQRAEVLNTALDHTIEVAELRLRGYDRQARMLEMEGLKPKPVSGNPESSNIR